mmetsp:Transcript_23932/g.36391  ORF Transcript_23932/g.36391 Transcript_23932/m.36391 type:complete len:229 (+) Transcript_23932:1201-1887(+)
MFLVLLCFYGIEILLVPTCRFVMLCKRLLKTEGIQEEMTSMATELFDFMMQMLGCWQIAQRQDRLPLPSPHRPLLSVVQTPPRLPTMTFAKMEKLATTRMIAEVGRVASRAIAIVATAATTGMMLLMVFRVPTADAEEANRVAPRRNRYIGPVAMACVPVGVKPTPIVPRIVPWILPLPHPFPPSNRRVRVTMRPANAIPIVAATSVVGIDGVVNKRIIYIYRERERE